MSFQGLDYLWLLLLAVPLVVVYFLKLKRSRVSLSSLVLWRQVMQDERVNAPFQRFRRNLLLLLQLLVLLLLVLAAARPTYLGFDTAAEHVPVIIDVSASMAARDGPGGRTRLEAAKAEVRELIAGASTARRLMLIAMGRTPHRVTGFTENPQILHAALDQLTVEDAAPDLGAALRLVNGIGRSVFLDRAVLISDGNLEVPGGITLAFGIDYRVLEPGGGNAGITGFNARRLPDESWEVLFRLEVAERLPARGRLVLTSDGATVFEETVALPSGDTSIFSVRVDAADEQELELRYHPAGFDSLAVDDRAWLRLPRLRPLRVGVDPELPLWARVMEAQPGVETVSLERAGDLAIGRDPADTAGTPVQVLIGRVPEDLRGVIGVERGEEEVVDWQRLAPILRHVILEDIHFGQRVRWDARSGALLLADRGYEVLVDGNHGPVLLRRRSDTAVRYWFLLRTDVSHLPFRVGFPVLAGNLASIARRRAGLDEVQAVATGVLPPVPVPPGAPVRVIAPDGTELTRIGDEEGLLRGVAVTAAGRYALLPPAGARQEVGVSLLDARETRLGVTRTLELEEVTVEAGSEAPGDQPLWKWLAVLMVGCMLWEWWYFARPPRTERRDP